jgi:tetratricopeptide (TPR) repeat protein
MFKACLKLDDENAELFYEYSILKEKQGNMEEALDLIEKAYNLYKDGDRELELTHKIITRYESFQEQLP